MPNALETINAGSPPEGFELTQVLKELQGLSISVVNGAAADTNIAVTGLGADDLVKSILYFPISGGNVTSVSDLTAELQAQTAGNIQISTTVTTDGTLVIVWFNKGALTD